MMFFEKLYKKIEIRIQLQKGFGHILQKDTCSLLSSNCTQLLLCIKCAKRLLLLKKVGEPLCVEMDFTRIFI